MSDTIHDFEESLKRGKAGEEIFHQYFKEKVYRLDGYNGDFKIKSNGLVIELKSDYWPMKNMFMERWSSKGRPGGPWQAQEKGNEWFVYMFPLNLTLFCFQTNQLVKWCEKLLPKYEVSAIKNKGWIGEGYPIPIYEFQPIFYEYKLKEPE